MELENHMVMDELYWYEEHPEPELDFPDEDRYDPIEYYYAHEDDEE